VKKIEENVMDRAMALKLFKAQEPVIYEALLAEGRASVDVEAIAKNAVAKAARDPITVGPINEDDVRRKASAAWQASAGLRAEFTDLAAYTAYEIAAAKGLVRVLGAPDTTDPLGNLPASEALARAVWDRDPALRAEFGSIEILVGYVKAAAAGRVKILNKTGER